MGSRNEGLKLISKTFLKKHFYAYDPNNMVVILLYCRYEEVVELLVKAGADVNAYSEFVDLTAMHHAAELRSLRAMKCLLDHKAEIPDMNSKGVRTVLHEAAHTGNVAMLELLLERGADKLVNSTDTVCTISLICA